MKEEFINSAFTLRSYTKTELAQLYMPHKNPRNAVRKFNEWLRFSSVLWDQLTRTGVTISTRVFNPMQVQIIVNYLGMP